MLWVEPSLMIATAVNWEVELSFTVPDPLIARVENVPGGFPSTTVTLLVACLVTPLNV
jgi:hypothetical protein